jgi:hypothetical protein
MGEPRITAEIPVPRDAYNLGVAVGAGSAWVGLEPRGRNGEDSIIRIDLATNAVVAEIPVATVCRRGSEPWEVVRGVVRRRLIRLAQRF